MRWFLRSGDEITLFSSIEWNEFSLYIEALEGGKLLSGMTILKSDYRSLVAKISHHGQEYIVKSPREKHRPGWNRWMTLFRSSEVILASKRLKKLEQLLLLGNRPVAAYEKRRRGQVVNSWQLYTYVEGHFPFQESFSRVSEKLESIHRLGYLHGDSQIANFIETASGEIAIIDAKLSKNYWGKFGRYMEIEYLCRSHEGFRELFQEQQKEWQYKCCQQLKQLQLLFRKIKRLREWFGYKKNQW